ncbi:baseplate J/gp47 family protein [Burkholderia gladioli]|uniref:baseplate J/gp47 family protein n=1 Tax=Burkholderia gladioli TaxID=28095 RepID=UPI0034DAEFA7
MTITTTAPTITAAGISAPTFADILDYLKTQYLTIYGPDAYLEDDSQDGQLLAVFARAISDSNSVAIGIYNAFSPAKAVGAALSNNVKINGIARQVASYSTVDVLIVGQAGTTITNGIVKDVNQNQWALPATVTIPPEGELTVTAVCTTIGAIGAGEGTVTTIGTPTRGWQSVTNASAAAEGAPVETDAALRQRQTESTALPSLTVLDGIVGAIANITGVTRCVPYENDTAETDANGIPSHSIALVVEGGDAIEIADAIATKKTPGSGTYGTTTVTVLNRYGIPQPINFFRPTYETITCALSIQALPGYSSVIGDAVVTAIVAYVNGVALGGGAAACVEWDGCIAAAKSVTGATTFKIRSLVLSGPGGAGTPDVPLLFNQAAQMDTSNVTLAIS